MHRRNLFRRTLLERWADWQRTRTPWACLAGLSFFVLALSHFVFERWFLMPPCEECVYIRLAFFTIMVGALIALIRPQLLMLRLIAYLQGCWGALYGVWHAQTLMGIHAALRSSDPMALFGVKNCSLTPDFPWGLPLADRFPALFLPKGPCGADLPVVPAGTVLGDLQGSLIGMIQEAGGWYLIPSLRWGSMADCAMILFVAILGWLLSAFFAECLAKTLMRRGF